MQSELALTQVLAALPPRATTHSQHTHCTVLHVVYVAMPTMRAPSTHLISPSCRLQF